MFNRLTRDFVCVATTVIIAVTVIKLFAFFGVRNDFVAGAWSMIIYYRVQSAYDLAFA